MAHVPTDLLPPQFYKDGESRPLKFGKSFLSDSNKKDEHISIMYDFKTPNSDKNKTTMDIGSDKNVTINIHHENTDDTTVYKGSMQPAAKDCFLIIDHVTGEITLERVASVIRVKRSREPGAGGGSSRQISTTPQDHNRMNRNTPPAISDSMPDLDFADEDDPMGNSQQQQHQHQPSSGNRTGAGLQSMPSLSNGAGSDSSGSSSSSSSSSSDSDSDDEQQHPSSKNSRHDNRSQHHNQQPQASSQAPPPHSSSTEISSNMLINDLDLSLSEDE